MKSSFESNFLKRFLCFGVAVSLFPYLTACSSPRDFSELKMELQEIRNRPKGVVDPAPISRNHDNFIYSATLARSPFEPPIVEVETEKKVVAVGSVKPDPLRRKEILEQFSIESLSMVGTIQKTEQGLYALVKDKKAVVYRVLPGNYIGRNHGRVTSIDTSKIQLVELIRNGVSGWIERPRSIVLKSD